VRTTIRCAAAATVAVLLVSGTAAAEKIPDQCRAAKHKQAGALAKCVHSSQAKLALSADTAAFDAAVAKCSAKFSNKWAGAETKATEQGGNCQTTGDAASIGEAIAARAACIADALETGDAGCLLCGNGVLDGDEDCEIDTIDGATCDSATGGADPFGAVTCGAGCVFDTSGCASGVAVGGYEWFLGAVGASCDATCTAEGLAYDPATATFAGSGGSDTNCSAVLGALGHPGPVFGGNLGTALGCIYGATAGPSLIGVRDTSPTTSSAVASSMLGTQIQRACACL
jgi:hypothetical protein